MNGHRSERQPNALNLTFESVEAESLAIALDLESFPIALGSVCSSGSTEHSHVLSTMGLPRDRYRSSGRMTTGRVNDGDDMEYLLPILPNTVNRPRAASPLTNK